MRDWLLVAEEMFRRHKASIERFNNVMRYSMDLTQPIAVVDKPLNVEVRAVSRFDYVAYDATAQALAASFKARFMELEEQVEAAFGTPKSAGVARYKAMLLTRLEDAYMTVGKTIRDDQIARNGAAALQEGRGAG